MQTHEDIYVGLVTGSTAVNRFTATNKVESDRSDPTWTVEAKFPVFAVDLDHPS